jgi:hypothetical protein
MESPSGEARHFQPITNGMNLAKSQTDSWKHGTLILSANPGECIGMRPAVNMWFRLTLRTSIAKDGACCSFLCVFTPHFFALWKRYINVFVGEASFG